MALVQQNGGTTNGSASIVTSLGSATTAGNSILIFANGAGTITTPSGFTSRSPQVNTQGLYLFEKLVASGNSSDTPTLTMSGAFNATWQIVEYSGITAFDVSSGNNAGFSGSTSVTTPSITPTTGARLLVAFVGVTADNSTRTWPAGVPNSWTNSFVGERSDTRLGTTGSGRDSMVGGWADRSGVTGNGSTTYSTNATYSPTNTAAPATIIASYKVTAGGTAYTLTAAGGSYVIAGTAATLRRTRNLVASAGSYAITGQAAALKYGKNLAATGGSYGITGAAASIIHAFKIAALAGSYSISGTSAALTRTHLPLSASAGAYSITGTSASLKRGYVLGAASGSYSISGTTTALRRSYLLGASSGAYAISGSAATLTKLTAYKLAASAGSYAISGATASVVHKWVLATSSGSYGITGSSATLTKIGLGVALSAGAGSYSITGTAAALKLGRKLAAAGGSYSISGQAAGVLCGRKLSAASGSYAISGTAAAVKFGRKLQAASGSYAIIGTAATLSYSGVVAYVLVADTASYLISGTPADVVYAPRVPLTNPLERLKMYTGSMGSVSNREDWIVNISLVGDDGTSFDLTGAGIVAYVCRDGRQVLSASLDNGIVLTDNYSMQWHFTEDQMAALCPAQYDVFCRVERDNLKTQLLAANVAIVEGGPQ